MGIKVKSYFFKLFIFLAGISGFKYKSICAELIELNRVVAKVNERVVTWGEIENAMTLLNFTETEKLSRANEFVDDLFKCNKIRADIGAPPRRASPI